MSNPTCEHRRVLTGADVKLIRECKMERDKLRGMLSELTDRKLAEKFECSQGTISRIKTGNESHYINLGGYPL